MTGKYTVCRFRLVFFSLEMLQAGAVKGLSLTAKRTHRAWPWPEKDSPGMTMTRKGLTRHDHDPKRNAQKSGGCAQPLCADDHLVGIFHRLASERWRCICGDRILKLDCQTKKEMMMMMMMTAFIQRYSLLSSTLTVLAYDSTWVTNFLILHLPVLLISLFFSSF